MRTERSIVYFVPPVPVPPWAIRSSSVVRVRMLCFRRTSVLWLVFMATPSVCLAAPDWPAFTGRSTSRAEVTVFCDRTAPRAVKKPRVDRILLGT